MQQTERVSRAPNQAYSKTLACRVSETVREVVSECRTVMSVCVKMSKEHDEHIHARNRQPRASSLHAKHARRT